MDSRIEEVVAEKAALEVLAARARGTLRRPPSARVDSGRVTVTPQWAAPARRCPLQCMNDASFAVAGLISRLLGPAYVPVFVLTVAQLTVIPPGGDGPRCV